MFQYRIPALFSTLLTVLCLQAQTQYMKGPSSMPYDQIRSGKLYTDTLISNIYPGTYRAYSVYVPAQYHAAKPAALMVFQDGHTYLKPDGDFNAPVVFDNLIAAGLMPVTIGVFINPGHQVDAPPPPDPWHVTNRSIEYDDLSDTYIRFLDEEVLPLVRQQYKISDDPKMHAICGISSGGICAFTAAWQRPDLFAKVTSHIGSFTNIRGGHVYPALIRENDTKDIRVFLQDGSGDLNNDFGNWWLANQQVASALAFKSYDYKFVTGDGGHDGKHAGSIFPESLTWLWRGTVPERIKAGVYGNSAEDNALIVEGATHLGNLSVQHSTLSGTRRLVMPEHEQLIVVRKGRIAVALSGMQDTVSAGSVVVVLPGDSCALTRMDEEARFDHLIYQSHVLPDLTTREGDETSLIRNFDELAFQEHSKGGLRSYFRTSTPMCDYYEMHMTSLLPDLQSHAPHVHKAGEIIFTFEGKTEMQIGNETFSAQPGSFYYIPSYVPHAIRNTGNETCAYLAFQWD